MTSFSQVAWIAVPAIVAVFLAGGVAGFAVGCGLMFRHGATLRFMARMNRWVSTREAFARLDVPVYVGTPGSTARRPILGTIFLVSGVVGVCLLLWRLDPRRAGAHINASLALSIALQTAKWIFVAGSAFAALVGAMMILAPQRLAKWEQSLNKWHSTEHLAAAPDRVHTPLEPLVESYPRVSGFIIALASLFVVLTMLGLVTKIH